MMDNQAPQQCLASSETSLTDADIGGSLTHELVHDLPQLYTKPSVQVLLATLRLLQRSNPTFDVDLAQCGGQPVRALPRLVDPSGVPRYLTSIISSSLEWLPEDQREQIWESASLRLSERAGRTAQPSMTRSFRINPSITLQLYEPSLTEDSLGLKTWTSSWLLAKRLSSLQHLLPTSTQLRVLELGAGTGLVGLAVVSIWEDRVSEVLLTDLPDIVPNLTKNIQLNSGSAPSHINVHSRILDWADESDTPTKNHEPYPVILAADPIYSADHPRMLADTVKRWLSQQPDSKFILELPLRQGYEDERADLRTRLESFLSVVDEGEDTGYDDWEAADGQAIEVRCWWSVWRSKDTPNGPNQLR